MFERIVVITRATQLEELTRRFNTPGQAKFYLEHAGQDFAPVQAAHDRYQGVVNRVRAGLPKTLKQQLLERDLLPQYSFDKDDLIITLGPNGLVVNTAKYLSGQPIIAINPDPAHEEGILANHEINHFQERLQMALKGQATINEISMAEAQLNDKQRLLGLNDLFIGPKSHVSARYQISQGDHSESQSSSGIIVSTGAGSTGWLRSIYAGSIGIVEALGGQVIPPENNGRIPWDADYLIYAVREPWPSYHSSANMVFGFITKDTPLVLTSDMPDRGVIFSDGVEQDYLSFNSGSQATISLASHKTRLIA